MECHLPSPCASCFLKIRLLTCLYLENKFLRSYNYFEFTGNESDDMSEGDFVRSVGNVERRIIELENEMHALGDKGDQEEKKLQEKIDALREERARLEQARQAKGHQLKDNKTEARKVKLEVDEVK